MSRRTAPAFEDNHPRFRPRPLPKPPTAQDSTRQFFDALDQARFDQVRRAVAAHPQCLNAARIPTNLHTFVLPATHLTPVDYALHNCRVWTALLEHCRRTGIAIPHVGDLTFRERLSAMNVIITWLLSQPNVAPPSHAPLHAAISCNFDDVCATLLRNTPHLATSLDPRKKTPLHICCRLASTMSPVQAASIVRRLAHAGADVNAKDVDGRTPLHDLIESLSESAPAYGLIRRRRRSPTLLSCAPVLDELLINGADMYLPDKRGSSAMYVAFASGVDYVVFAQRAKLLREKICATRFAKRCRQRHAAVTGLWGELPDDAVSKIFKLLSPRDVVAGIGATCVGLRRIAVSERLWRHLETTRCMAAVRQNVLHRTAQQSAQVV